MIAFVEPRYVAPPWKHDALAGSSVSVGREAGLEPEPGPLAEYQSVFPERYVRWEVRRQLWEIRQLNPLTGLDERVELIFDWASPPEADGAELTEEELADAIANQRPSLRKVYRHFDYPLVRRRLKEWYLFRHNGGARGLTKRLAEAERIRDSVKRRDFAREGAAAWNELRRYFPVLAALHSGRTVQDALTEKIPLTSVGIDLRRASPQPPAPSREIVVCHS